ncbi:Hypothetical protein, putative [Bodo saltans]|uniref:Uncharacterized protein n=1 Tax=Bodo saltans TaxID=75058 RepID=A0A0S4JNI0_BODSA|nr:Hypothetical protein, putative [Bodo saltans]|eukprot:CUG91694.1 Hypothetical protein, putative [Bodo saltans]
MLDLHWEHFDARPIACFECAAPCASFKAVREHFVNEHVIFKQESACLYCGMGSFADENAFKDHMVKAGELMRCPVDGCTHPHEFDIVDELMAHIAQAHPADAKTYNSDTIRLSSHKIPSLMNDTYECNSVDLANW